MKHAPSPLSSNFFGQDANQGDALAFDLYVLCYRSPSIPVSVLVCNNQTTPFVSSHINQLKLNQGGGEREGPKRIEKDKILLEGTNKMESETNIMDF